LKDNTLNHQENWDVVIKPQSSWLKVNLGDLWRYRDLVMLFVKRDFVSVYKQTILGPLWFVLQPVLTSITFLIVFGSIAKIPTGETPSFLFYLSGLVGWNYFADCLNKTSNTFVNNAGIFGKVYFPRLAVPVSIVISSMINFFIQFVLFLGFFIYYYSKDYPIAPNAYILLTPLLVLIMAGLGLGLGIIISSLTTKYRDLRFLVGFGVQLLMYVSCVIFPLENIDSERYRHFLLLNPMSIIIESFRYAFLGHGYFSWYALAYCCVFTIITLFVGVVFFNRVEKNFMDTV